jgi:uncharacterized membrane protein
MSDTDSGQPAGAPTSKAFVYVPLVGTVAIGVAFVLALLDVVPMGVVIALLAIAAPVMVGVAWSAWERHPNSWTRAEDEDDDPRP